jgi:hypothetical protein
VAANNVQKLGKDGSAIKQQHYEIVSDLAN